MADISCAAMTAGRSKQDEGLKKVGGAVNQFCTILEMRSTTVFMQAITI